MVYLVHYLQAITGLLGGPIAAVFLVGIFFDKVESKAVWVGFILSVIVAFYISDPAGMLTKFIPGYAKPKIFEFMISFIIIGVGIIGSFLASFAFGKPSPEKIKGLTYSTTMKNQK